MKLFIFKKRSKPNYTESTFECCRDGLTIRGTEYRPAGENLPVAIVCHGFMAFQDTVRQYTKLLAELGYAAFCFDFCGGSLHSAAMNGRWSPHQRPFVAAECNLGMKKAENP